MITVYSKNQCHYCDQAKAYLKSKNINYREINIETDPEAREFVIDQGHRTMPQIYMDGKIFVKGGWQGLSKMTAEDIQSEIDLRNSLADQTI
jgi:alkyl hydroperoxide reductase subunit F